MRIELNCEVYGDDIINVKWAALVLIALLAGFGGGFISSYLVFQQQMANLRMETRELQKQLSDLKTIYSEISILLEAQNELISELREQVANLEQLRSNISILLETIMFCQYGLILHCTLLVLGVSTLLLLPLTSNDYHTRLKTHQL